MRAAKVQASLRIRAISPEPSLLAHTSSESRGTFRQKARSLAPLNGWASAVKIWHDGMLEDTNSLDGAHLSINKALIKKQCVQEWLNLKNLLFYQKVFYGIKLLHANVLCVYIVYAKYQMASVKALLRVDFPVHALSGKWLRSQNPY